MLRKHCEACVPTLLNKFDEIFNDEDLHVGFIVNERIINIPPQISPPSFAALRYVVNDNRPLLISAITEEPFETTYFFQYVTVATQCSNVVFFMSTFGNRFLLESQQICLDENQQNREM